MKVVIIGAQWGDEGKGKIVDYLASDADMVVRFSGGANAGHTIVFEDTTYKLHLVPSGIVYPDKSVVLGSGMVVDPEALFDELAELETQGIQWEGRVFISDRAHIVLPGHKRRDIETDKKRKIPLGTTGRGIGITYGLKAQRDGIRFADLGDENRLNTLDSEDREFLEKYGPRLEPMLVNLASFMAERAESRILFEGAQGILLDLDIGTYPFVSSGISAAAGAAAGGGVGPRSLDTVMGVFKAYSTRVGNGPFPSEFREDRDGELTTLVRELGREYGVTTGRPRRCGYLDLVALRYACRTNSLDSLVMTHLDVYDEFESISACVGYRIDGKIIEDFPSAIPELDRAEPVIETMKGWKSKIGECRSYDELPREARDYLEFIEEYTGTPIGIISVGYRRSETIIRRDLWT
ncbi:MAG: adenylosuccinate synthase [Spirochaetia bacterium]